ncbi:unnamed protein product, partial [Fusarium graminearum]
DDAGESEQNQNQQDRDDGDSDEYVPDDKSDTSSPHGEECPDTLTVASGDDEQENSRFKGMILAGPPGLGKTLSALATIAVSTAKTGSIKGPCIIVAPRSSCQQWMTEIETFFKHFRLLYFLSPKRTFLTSRGVILPLVTNLVLSSVACFNTPQAPSSSKHTRQYYQARCESESPSALSLLQDPVLPTIFINIIFHSYKGSLIHRSYSLGTHPTIVTMPIGLGIYGGHLLDDRWEGNKSDKVKKQTPEEKLVNTVVEKMKGKLEEEAKKLAAKSPATSNSINMKPLPATPANLFSLMDEWRVTQSHPMRRAASFSYAEQPPYYGQPYPRSSSRFRYDEQPEYSHAPYSWSTSASPYSAASPHVPPPPYTHTSTFNNSSYQPRMSSSIPYQSFPNRPPSPYHSYYAPLATSRYPSDLKHEASFYTPSYSKRHGASAPQIVISSKPYLHSRYPSGHEYLRTDVGFYPYNPDPNVNGLAWLSKKGFETQQDITVNFEDYDGFIRTHCPDARLLVPYQDLP